jgi:hypothetical protein
MKIPDMKERILMSIGKEPTPIHQIAKNAGVCVTTASKYCYILQAEKKVEIKSFGNMKLVK